MSNLHPKHAEWLAGRSLDPLLAEKFGLTSTQQGGNGFWLTVPYIENGQVVNHKLRQTAEKRHRMDAGAPLTLWNHDALLSEPVRSGQVPVVITEGEWDALAAIQSGFQHTVSVPNGGPNEPSRGELTEEGDAERYRFLWRAKAHLDAVSSFILAVDGDPVGRILASELARRLGPERCRFVTYPAGCKDLNEVLDVYGSGGVALVLNDAKPYPVKGLYRFSDFPDPADTPSIPLYLPGAVDGPHLLPGTLMVWTGFAGSGKTSLMVFIIADLLRRGINVAMGSFETAVKPILQRKLRAAIMQCSDNDVGNEKYVSTERVAEADELLEQRFSIICQDFTDEEHEMTLEEMLELARIAVLRDGARLLIFDPWNELEHKRRPDETETDYTGRAIRAIKAFARQYMVAVWIVAHPKKPMQWGQKPDAPGLYDISGSSHWANKADYGAVIYRPNKENNETQLIICKVRMGLPGREQTVKMEWQWTNSTYVSREIAEAA
ncbi:DnaB-like helicase C-terminal domain-containing protein [Sphingomonas endolithica]|uniref:DnaB-like helicase C-terminal domain-containing protein n=1 Tax=Sphingomonas endolithica TaxID=2972485 RepID=UPI0021B0269E|nr:DnaB-like helicase C-terminal domain-containing protein [Sphingomonas sp. ZFBP2030]